MSPYSWSHQIPCTGEGTLDDRVHPDCPDVYHSMFRHPCRVCHANSVWRFRGYDNNNGRGYVCSAPCREVAVMVMKLEGITPHEDDL